jgi:hypothetical protein
MRTANVTGTKLDRHTSNIPQSGEQSRYLDDMQESAEVEILRARIRAAGVVTVDTSFAD